MLWKNFRFIAIGFSMLCQMVSAFAQTPDKKDVNPPPSLTFPASFESLAAQKHITFVMEATPLQKELATDKAIAVKQALDSNKVAEEEKIQILSNAFDYEAERVSTSVYVLRKRYSDPEDVPFVTWAENENSLKNIKRAIQDAFPGFDDSMRTEMLLFHISRLFPVRDGEKINDVPIRYLSPQQQKIVYQAVVRRYLSSFLSMKQEYEAFHMGIKEKSAHFRWMDHRGMFLFFGFNYPRTVFAPDGQPERVTWNFRLSHGAEASIQGSTDFDIPKRFVGPEGRFVEALPDPTAPQENAEKIIENLPGWAGTPIHDVILSLSQRLKQQLHPKKITVDSAIQDKTVTLIGEKTVDPESLLSALAQTYGLRIAQPEKNELHLTLPTYKKVREIHELPQAVFNSIPLSLLRAWKGQIQTGREQLIASGWIEKNPKLNEFFNNFAPKMKGDFSRKAKTFLLNQQAKEERIKVVRAEVIRFIRAKVQPLVEKPDGKLPMWKSDPTAKHLISCLGMLELIPEILSFQEKPVPEFLLNYETLTLTIERKVLTANDIVPKGVTGVDADRFKPDVQRLQGKQAFEFRLTYRDKENKEQRGPAIYMVFSPMARGYLQD